MGRRAWGVRSCGIRVGRQNRKIILLVLKTKLIKKLSGRRTWGLEVPSFIKDRVMWTFHHPRIDINVADILICGIEVNKYPIKMMVIEFSPTFPRLTDTDTRAEYLHVP
jgi:hypothetical protein